MDKCTHSRPCHGPYIHRDSRRHSWRQEGWGPSLLTGHQIPSTLSGTLGHRVSGKLLQKSDLPPIFHNDHVLLSSIHAPLTAAGTNEAIPQCWRGGVGMWEGSRHRTWGITTHLRKANQEGSEEVLGATSYRDSGQTSWTTEGPMDGVSLNFSLPTSPPNLHKLDRFISVLC